MLNGCPQPRRTSPPVCPLPRSLATTCGISFDFSSSPYLDVSVQAVPHLRLFHSTQADSVLRCRVPPFGHPRIDAYLRLPVAYRSLSRPSSAPDAKAFPLCSYQLDLVGPVPIRARALQDHRIMQAHRSFQCGESFYPAAAAPAAAALVSTTLRAPRPLGRFTRLHCPLLLASSLKIYIVQFSRCTPAASRQPLRSLKTRPKRSFSLRMNASVCPHLVEVIGLEPVTPCLQSRCSTN